MIHRIIEKRLLAPLDVGVTFSDLGLRVVKFAIRKLTLKTAIIHELPVTLTFMQARTQGGGGAGGRLTPKLEIFPVFFFL